MIKTSERTYYAPHGGHPGQTELLTGRAVFTEAYAVIPKGVMQDIVTSPLPFWDKTRAWIIARPLSGFAETFSQYIMEVFPGGGSTNPEPDPSAEGVLFVVSGQASLTFDASNWNVPQTVSSKLRIRNRPRAGAVSGRPSSTISP